MLEPLVGDMERLGLSCDEMLGERDCLVRSVWEGRGMYLKRFVRKKGRRKVAYVSVAHNVRQKKADSTVQTLPVIVLNLGREDELDEETREASMAVAQALYDRRIAKGDSPAEALAAVQLHMRPAQAPIAVKSSRVSSDN